MGPFTMVGRLAAEPRITDDPEWPGRRDLDLAWRMPDAYLSAQFKYGSVFYGQMDRNWGPVGIEGIDTRALTTHLRDHGSQQGVISHTDLDPKRVVRKAQEAPSILGRDLVKEVTWDKPYNWMEGSGRWALKNGGEGKGGGGFRVVAYDFGIKYNILRRLVDEGFEVTVVPASTTGDAALALHDTCTGPLCELPARDAQLDHATPWWPIRPDGPYGTTDIDNLALLCAACHRLVHHAAWQIRMAADRRPEAIPPAWLDPTQQPRRFTAPHTEPLLI